MDASAWAAIAAALISLGAVAVAVSQAKSARQQASHSKTQAEHAEIQAGQATRQADAAIRQTELQERVHRDSQQPYVWVDFRLDPAQGSLMHLVVRNEGPTVAENVCIFFDPPLQGAGTVKELDGVNGQLSNGLQSVPPGREMRWAFAVGHKLYADDSDTPRRYEVTVTGKGPYGDLPPLSYPINLDEMKEIAAPRLGSLEKVTKAIEKVADQLAKRPPTIMGG